MHSNKTTQCITHRTKDDTSYSTTKNMHTQRCASDRSGMTCLVEVQL